MDPPSSAWAEVPASIASESLFVTTVGVPGHGIRGRVSGDGRVRIDGGPTLNFWLHDSLTDQLLLPEPETTSFSLPEGYLPFPRVRWSGLPGLEIETQVSALFAGETFPQPEAETFFLITIRLFNWTGAVRPVRLMVSSEGPALIPPRDPDFVGIGDSEGRWQPISLAPASAGRDNGEPRVMAFDLELTSAEGSFARAVAVAQLSFVIPAVQGTRLPAPEEIRQRHLKTHLFWVGADGLNRIFCDIPHRIFLDAFRATTATLLLGWKGDNAPSCSPAEAAWAALALARTGHCQSGRGLLTPHIQGLHELTLRTQGLLLFALEDHYRFTRDDAWLQSVAPPILAAGSGLLERITEIPGEDRPFHEECWIVHGLRSAAVLATGAGDDALAGTFAEGAATQSRNLIASITECVQEHGITFIPESRKGLDLPENLLDQISLAWPEPIFNRKSLLVHRSFEHYWRVGFAEQQGAYKQGEQILSEGIQMALPFIVLNMHEPATRCLDRFLDFQSFPGALTWFDRFPAVKGSRPSIRAAAAYLIAFRTLFLRERGEQLVLSPCLPISWIEVQDTLEIKNAPTYYGKISYRTRNAEGATEVVIDRDNPPPKGYVLPPPVISYEPELTVDGKKATYDLNYERKQEVPIPGHARTFKVTW